MQSLPAEPAIWLRLVIVVGLIVIVGGLIRTVLPVFKGKHGSGIVLVIASVFALGLLFWFVDSLGVFRAPPNVKWAYGPDPSTLPTEIRVSKVEAAADPTLEALWDKLTKSKINLDGEADPTPPAVVEDEAIKEAVGKTFGLDNRGKLPPDWVIHPPKRVGQVLRETVASDPFVTEAECRRQLEREQIPHVVARHIGYLASAKMGYSVTIPSPLTVGIGLDYIFREICRDEFTGTIDSSVGEMKKIHVLLEFNPHIDQHLTEAWLRTERHARLAYFGRIVGLSLTGLALAYGLLRFDTWSQGYYSKQLLVGSVLAIIAVAVVLLKT